MPIYQISAWDTNFENSRSREIEHPAFVIMPNKQHGMGFQRILGQLDGVAMFGLWVLILQACSRQRQNEAQQREGWLTDDGTAAGVPWDAEDLALRWKQPVEFCERALALFSHPKVGWLRRHDAAGVVPIASAEDRQSARQDGADRTEQNGTENRTEGPGAVAAAGPPRTATTAAAKRHRVEGVDKRGVVTALELHDVVGLAKAFGGNTRDGRGAEWAREADGLTLETVVAILGWQRHERSPVREPSGLRAARARWKNELTDEYRREIALGVFKGLGIAIEIPTAAPPVPA